MKNYWIIPKLTPSQSVDGKNIFLFKSFFYEVEMFDNENLLEEIMDFAEPTGLTLEEEGNKCKGTVYLTQTDLYGWDNMISKIEMRLPREEDGISYIFKNQKFMVENHEGFYLLKFKELWANYSILSPSIVKIGFIYNEVEPKWIK